MSWQVSLIINIFLRILVKLLKMLQLTKFLDLKKFTITEPSAPFPPYIKTRPDILNQLQFKS